MLFDITKSFSFSVLSFVALGVFSFSHGTVESNANQLDLFTFCLRLISIVYCSIKICIGPAAAICEKITSAHAIVRFELIWLQVTCLAAIFPLVLVVK